MGKGHELQPLKPHSYMTPIFRVDTQILLVQLKKQLKVWCSYVIDSFVTNFPFITFQIFADSLFSSYVCGIFPLNIIVLIHPYTGLYIINSSVSNFGFIKRKIRDWRWSKIVE